MGQPLCFSEARWGGGQVKC